MHEAAANVFKSLCSMMHFNRFFYYFCRLFADILNDIAMFMEILAPYFPAVFTLIMCVSGIFKVRQTRDGAIDCLCFFVTNLQLYVPRKHFYHYILAELPKF